MGSCCSRNKHGKDDIDDVVDFAFAVVVDVIVVVDGAVDVVVVDFSFPRFSLQRK